MDRRDGSPAKASNGTAWQVPQHAAPAEAASPNQRAAANITMAERSAGVAAEASNGSTEWAAPHTKPHGAAGGFENSARAAGEDAAGATLVDIGSNLTHGTALPFLLTVLPM